MRSCCAVYVDVGYLLAAAATRVTGSSLRRGVQTDYAALIEALAAQAEADSGLPLLRINWYDAGGRPGGRPDLSQDEIGLLPNVKLRLGRLSYTGEQKGVDVRIGLDLAIQARQRIADVVYLVSGDDDLTEAVEEAQGHGVQIVLLAVPRNDGKPLAAAKHLLREVDRMLVIDADAIDAAVRPAAIPEALVPAPFATGDADAAGAQDGGSDAAATPTVGTGATDGTGAADGAGDSAGTTPSDGPGRVRRRVTRVGGQVLPSGPTPTATPSATPAAPVPGPPPGMAPTPRGPATGEAPAAPAAGVPAPIPGTTDAAPRPGSPGGAPGGAPAGVPSAVPSPALFAGRKAAGVALPDGVVAAPRSVAPDGVTIADIDAVARQVVASWCASATLDSLGVLRDGAPKIPSELDRALLMDLSGLVDGEYLEDDTRHELRARFWYHVGRVRAV